MKPRVITPCTGHCILSIDEICNGCYRTLHEIAIWYKSSDEVRQEIKEKCLERKPK